MNQRTFTTLGELRIGDRFVFGPARVDVWQVVNQTQKHTEVNQYAKATGRFIHKYDERKKKTTRVLFIRHTVPVPGEEFFMEDLKEGDVFTLPQQSTQYTVAKTGDVFYTITQPDGSKGKAGILTKIIFVKHGGL